MFCESTRINGATDFDVFIEAYLTTLFSADIYLSTIARNSIQPKYSL